MSSVLSAVMWNGINLQILQTGIVGDGHAHISRLRNRIKKLRRRNGGLGSIQTVEQIIVGNEGYAQSHLSRVMGKVVANFIDPTDWWGGVYYGSNGKVCKRPESVYHLGVSSPSWK